MISLKLTNCVECTTIPSLLSDIDCKLTELAKNQYNNIVFALNKTIPREAMIDLLNYKRILIYRLCNEDYAHTTIYTTELIASKVKLLKFK